MDEQKILAKLRDICLALPKTSETITFGHPTFQVGTKTFSVLETYKGELSICFKVGKKMQPVFLQDPRFYRTPYVGQHGWVSLRANTRLNWKEIAELAHGSYELVTMKKEAQVTAERASRLVAGASILVSAALAAAKIIIGLRANSTAVVSDGLESAGDVLTSGLVLFGLLIATKPPDAQHPYGHGRLEELSGLVVGMMLVVTGSLISFRSLQRAWEPQHAPAAYAVWPLIASILAKSATSFFKWRFGRRIRSAALTADAWNDAMDILSGTTALVAVAITLADPVRFSAADHLGGSAVGLIVIFVGVRVVRDTTLQLMDTMPDPGALDRIREVALTVPGALGVEKCYARKTGLQWHVDLHLEVAPGMSVYESHQIATEVRIRIKETLDWVADVLVHVEPHMLDTISNRTDGKS